MTGRDWLLALSDILAGAIVVCVGLTLLALFLYAVL